MGFSDVFGILFGSLTSFFGVIWKMYKSEVNEISNTARGIVISTAGVGDF